MYSRSMATALVGLLTALTSANGIAESTQEKWNPWSAKSNGMLSCSVTGQAIHVVDEGKYSQFLGFEDSHYKNVGIGEQFNLQYEVNAYRANISLRRQTNNSLFFGQNMSDFENASNPRGVQLTADKLGISLENNNGVPATRLAEMLFHPDRLRVTDMRGAQLYLSRYYKGDWSGLLVEANMIGIKGDAVLILAFDCRTTKDDLDTAFRILKNRVREE